MRRIRFDGIRRINTLQGNFQKARFLLRSGSLVILFRLFVAGDNPRSRNAIDHARGVCGQLPSGRWKLDVVDVLSDSEQAQAEGILATPTLLCHAPYADFRVVGKFQAADLLLRLFSASDQIM